MITHTLTAPYVDNHRHVCGWIDAVYEGATESRHGVVESQKVLNRSAKLTVENL